MKENEIPQNLLTKLKTEKISPERILFLCQSDTVKGGGTGESWLLGLPNRIVMYSSPPFGDIEQVFDAPKEKIAQIIASRTFLRNLVLKFFTSTGEEVLTFEVSSLFEQNWEAYKNYLKELFPGKMDESEELSTLETSLNFTVPPPMSVDTRLDTADTLSIGSKLISADLQQHPLPSNPNPEDSVKNVDFSQDMLNMQSSVQNFQMPDISSSVNQNVTESTPETVKTFEKNDSRSSKQLPKPKNKPAVPAVQTKKPAKLSEIKCQKCGSQNSVDYDYCLNCGEQLRKENEKYSRAKRTAFGSSATSATNPEDVSGCITGIFKFAFWIMVAYAILKAL
ncbi:MAG: zinc ribbon domain-containing protein [Candidatus Riflebacteria bacterium]|nr:zinc ribbon domain-containing protein [Candidatus Riflebacteria bacterium]